MPFKYFSAKWGSPQGGTEGVHSECNTCYKWDPLSCVPIAHCTCSVSCRLCSLSPLPVFTLDSSTSSFAMQNKTIPQWVVSANGGVLAMAGVGADAIARCGAQEALACVTGRWGPCRTSRNAPIGCPQSHGFPTGGASETPSGRSPVFLLAPGILEKKEEARMLLFVDDNVIMVIMVNRKWKKVNKKFHNWIIK